MDDAKLLAPTGQAGLEWRWYLYKIFHAAYDRDILGVRPDLVMEIRLDILRETDGPMLQHGLQEMAGTRVHVPRHRIPARTTSHWKNALCAGC